MKVIEKLRYILVTSPYQWFTQVAELETLGGHAVVLCAYDGICYQGSAGIGDSLLKTNIMETFASRLHSEYTDYKYALISTLLLICSFRSSSKFDL